MNKQKSIAKVKIIGFLTNDGQLYPILKRILEFYHLLFIYIVSIL
jgi:hypothetical protein